MTSPQLEKWLKAQAEAQEAKRDSSAFGTEERAYWSGKANAFRQTLANLKEKA